MVLLSLTLVLLHHVCVRKGHALGPIVTFEDHTVLSALNYGTGLEVTRPLKVLQAQIIFQLQSAPYDPKYIDLYRVNTNLPQ